MTNAVSIDETDTDTATDSDDTDCLYIDAHGPATSTTHHVDDSVSVRSDVAVDLDVTIEVPLDRAEDMFVTAYRTASKAITSASTTTLRRTVIDHVEEYGFEFDSDQRCELTVELDGPVDAWIALAERTKNPRRFCANVSGQPSIGNGVDLAYGEFKRREDDIGVIRYE